jgi:biopolymer transport protein ExbD
MRASHKARANESPMDLQLGPLIDCVFLLLTYFIFTITLTTTEGLLPSQLAVGDESQQQEQPPPEEREIIVRMVQTGSRVQSAGDAGQDLAGGDRRRPQRHL